MYRAAIANDVNCPQSGCALTYRNDPYGLSSPVPSGTSAGTPPPTGPNEICVVALRSISSSRRHAGRDFGKNGLAFCSFLGTTNSNTIFKCPIEQQWQCAYAMNYSTGSPAAQRDSFVTQTSTPGWSYESSPHARLFRFQRQYATPRPPYLPFVGGNIEPDVITSTAPQPDRL